MPEGHVTVVPVDRGPSSTAAASKQVEILSLSFYLDVPKRGLKIFYFLAKKSTKKCFSTDVQAGGDLVLGMLKDAPKQVDGKEAGKGVLGIKGDWSSRDQSPCTAR